MGLSNDLSCEAGSLSCCRPNPHGCFLIRGLRLYFPELEPWVTRAAWLPAVRLGLSVRECRAAGSASGQTACPVPPTLRQSWSGHGNVGPLHRGCPSPPLLLVWMYVSFLSTWCQTSLPFDFLSVLVVRGGAVCLPMLPSWFFFSPPPESFETVLAVFQVYVPAHCEFS